MTATEERRIDPDELAQQIGTTGRRARRRRGLLLAGVAAVAIVAFGLEMVWGGSSQIPFADVLPAALGLQDGLNDYVIHETRLPRALTAFLAGALFGLAGSLYQRLIGNPLATPDVIGVTAGASTGAVLVLTVLGGTGLAVQSGALVGAVIAAIGIYLLSWRGGIDTYRLVLVGIGLGACCAAL
ncbi:MAG: iron chelate uptake ABC transporter family permease subunit, partial [Nakamurella sp.]